MTSEIDVDMPICDKRIKVRVTSRDDGDMDVEIVSDCPALAHYAESLRVISMDDITSFETSVINRESVRGNMSMICAAPIAVYHAAWMECGMLSPGIYRKMGPVAMGTPEAMEKGRRI